MALGGMVGKEEEIAELENSLQVGSVLIFSDKTWRYFGDWHVYRILFKYNTDTQVSNPILSCFCAVIRQKNTSLRWVVDR